MDRCDQYSHCGKFSICDPYNNVSFFECKCLPGYEPMSPLDWYLRDGSYGCVKKHRAFTCAKGEGSVKVVHVKAQDTSMVVVDMSMMRLDECKDKCLRNCSCKAFATVDLKLGGGCMMWHGSLIDTKKLPAEAGQDLYVRVDAPDLAEYENVSHIGSISKTRTVETSVVSVLLCVLLVSLVYWKAKRMRKLKDIRKSIYPFSVSISSTDLEESPGAEDLDESKRNSVLPLFDLNTIVAATSNFSVANKLEKGGFGSVYKGMLPNGKQIAVKGLS